MASIGLTGCEDPASIRLKSLGGEGTPSAAVQPSGNATQPGDVSSPGTPGKAGDPGKTGDGGYPKKPKKKCSDDDDRESPDRDGGRDSSSCDNPYSMKVKICHVPEGHPSAKQTLCVGLQAATFGHGISLDGQDDGDHDGDYLGACKD